MSPIAHAPPLRHLAGQTTEESILERLRGFIRHRRGARLEGDERLQRELERAFAEFAREMQG